MFPYLLSKFAHRGFIHLQRALSLLDSELTCWKDPLMALFVAHAAITFLDDLQLRDLDVKLERPTMAIAIVSLDLRSFLRHNGRVGWWEVI